MTKKRILSGIQPTNILHIGNLIGAISQWVPMQKEYESFFCIVDLHAITVKHDPKILGNNIRKLAAMYIACGIDPKQSIIFPQSRVSAHAELTWILNTLTSMSELERMTQYKDKSKQHEANINVGLFDYPVLMASDILLYSPDFVPVGEDQTQHVELTRNLATRFNKRYGNVFKVPKLQLKKSGARIMALDDPEKKMSKSAGSILNYIALDDDAETIRRKIQKAVTDSGKDIVFDVKRKGLYNLLTIYKYFSGMAEAEIQDRFQDQGYGVFKKALADLVVNSLKPIQMSYFELMKQPKIIDDVLDFGTKRAKKIADAKLHEVFSSIGLY